MNNKVSVPYEICEIKKVAFELPKEFHPNVKYGFLRNFLFGKYTFYYENKFLLPICFYVLTKRTKIVHSDYFYFYLLLLKKKKGERIMTTGDNQLNTVMPL
ncbi:hypothetical protein AK88_04456 [Plasmodium fragile]|uniref:Uncharacterized protein n=1 Tax=Plasmodium fragile TaxID=5857 RepID=A0A0D9QFY5_PLAFR|nr:uncharacterized protein AK88_04456 [Plasmodium fragile]KJP85924.1 hypothetical protein AK88_04456 [Plasmodium fragile]